jgi:hypothetical protein
VPGANQPAYEVRSIGRLREEEPQRRHYAIHRRHRHAEVALLDLETSYLLCGRGVGRASQKRCKARDITDVVALCLAAEPAHLHLIDETLA